jgi:hypothetical protein
MRILLTFVIKSGPQRTIIEKWYDFKYVGKFYELVVYKIVIENKNKPAGCYVIIHVA